MNSLSWAEVARADRVLADRVRRRLEGAVAYFSTVRPDGWPRVHPLGVMFRHGECVVVMGPRSPKRRNLERNGRYAVHCAIEDNYGGGGEALVSGIAVLTEPTDDDVDRGWIAFELLVAEVLSTTYDYAALRPRSIRWTPK